MPFSYKLGSGTRDQNISFSLKGSFLINYLQAEFGKKETNFTTHNRHPPEDKTKPLYVHTLKPRDFSDFVSTVSRWFVCREKSYFLSLKLCYIRALFHTA